MTYRALPEHLHRIANAAQKYFKKEFGLTSPKIEQEINENVEYRPTFHGVMPDKTYLCVEVSEDPSAPELFGFILSCKNHSFPARLWVVVPKGIKSLTTKQIGFARENGIGIVEIDENGTGLPLLNSPLSLSLTGLRAIRYSGFPTKYKDALRTAHETFCSGNPSKGCSMLYDEIESLSRRILKKCISKNHLNGTPSTMDIDKESWVNVLEYSKKNINISKAACPDLKPSLFNRILGLTEYRNDSGHKPNSTAKLIARDRQLRTRFEAAVDDLDALIKASSSLRV